MRAVCSGKIEKLLPLLQFRVQFYIDLVTQQPIELRLEPMTTIGSDLLDTKNSSQGGYRMSPNKMVARGRAICEANHDVRSAPRRSNLFFG
jgi:hypothetical protein